MDQTEAALPDDALAEVLRLLPPRDLAVSRCVAKAWCAAIDARRLLLAHLLPHSLRGIYVNYIDYRCPHFFARPSAQRDAVDGNLDYLPVTGLHFTSMLDHCNGLLLYGHNSWELSVVNPATKRWERLPRKDTYDYIAYLVFDPAVSLHYQVVLVDQVPEKPEPRNMLRIYSSLKRMSVEQNGPAESSRPKSSIEEEEPHDLMEWPPSQWTLQVFSSVTGQWQERSFVREGDTAETMANVQLDSRRPMEWGPRWRYSVYWRGALYIHCRGGFVTRLSLSKCKYQVIRTPVDFESIHTEPYRTRPYLGRSEKGVYFTTINNKDQLRVWNLNESSGHIDWVLKHQIDINLSSLWAAICSYRPEADGPWILENDIHDDANTMVPPGVNFDWDSDDDNAIDIQDVEDEENYKSIYLLGFHPYKETVLLNVSFIGVAYHLNSSKVQYLGKLRPKDYWRAYTNGVYESFPYTPCMIDGLPESNSEKLPGDKNA